MKEIKLTQEEIDIIFNSILIEKYEIESNQNTDRGKISLCESILKKLS